MTKARDLSDLGGGITQDDLPAEGVNESKLQVSNAPTNGYALTAQSGNTGGLTWAEMAGGGLIYIASSGVISGSPNEVDFTQFDASKYDAYVFMFNHVKPVTDAVFLFARTSTDGGSSYASGASDYIQYSSQASSISLTQNTVGNNVTEYGVSGRFEVYHPDASAFTYTFSALVSMDTIGRSNSQASNTYSGGIRQDTGAVNAIRFYWSSGSFANTGEIKMYGITNG